MLKDKNSTLHKIFDSRFILLACFYMHLNSFYCSIMSYLAIYRTEKSNSGLDLAILSNAAEAVFYKLNVILFHLNK